MVVRNFINHRVETKRNQLAAISTSENTAKDVAQRRTSTDNMVVVYLPWSLKYHFFNRDLSFQFNINKLLAVTCSMFDGISAILIYGFMFSFEIVDFVFVTLRFNFHGTPLSRRRPTSLGEAVQQDSL